MDDEAALPQKALDEAAEQLETGRLIRYANEPPEIDAPKPRRDHAFDGLLE